MTHTAPVRLDVAGPARVRIRGRALPHKAEIVVGRDVLVR